MNELEALRSVDFDWTVHLQSVWQDSPYDVSALHADLRNEITAKLDVLKSGSSPHSPLGWPVVGVGGSGKTHLLSVIRHEAISRGIAFVLVNMTDVRSFADNVLLGYLSSLQQSLGEGRFQYQIILERFIKRLQPSSRERKILDGLRRAKTQHLAEVSRQVVDFLRKTCPGEALTYQDAIRALLCLNSDNLDMASMA